MSSLRSRSAIVLLLALYACNGTPEPIPFRPPQVETQVAYFRGQLLSGAADPALAGDTGDSADPLEQPSDTLLIARCSLLFVSEVVETLAPLASHCRLVVGARGDQVLLPTAVLAPDARVGFGDRESLFDDREPPLQRVPIDRLAGLLPPDSSVVFGGSARRDTELEDGTRVDRQVGVIVARIGTGDEIEVSLLIEDFTPLGFGAAASEPAVLQRQLMVLEDRPIPGGESLVLMFGTTDGTPGAFCVFLDLERADDTTPDLDQLRQACAAGLQASVTEAVARAMTIGRPESELRSLRSGLRSLRNAEPTDRRSVVFLADRAGARLALDLALSANDELFSSWVTRFLALQDTAATPDLPTDDTAAAQAIGWALESSAYEELADRLDRGELDAALHGILVVHAGDPATSAPVLRGAIRRATDLATLREALIAENRAALRSADPSDRVRAHDWLASRAATVPDYDPLADRGTRRAALRADVDRRATGAETPLDPAGIVPTDTDTTVREEADR